MREIQGKYNLAMQVSHSEVMQKISSVNPLSRLAQLRVPKVPPLCEMSSTHLGDIGEI